MAAEFSELMAALGQVRAALAERLHVDASWRALMQLEARAAAGQLLPGPDAARLRTSLDRELARNRVYQALRRVDDALAVLKAPDIPSILVETAFISNPAEEMKLRNEGQQMRFARSIHAGVKRYFAQNPALARAQPS